MTLKPEEISEVLELYEKSGRNAAQAARMCSSGVNLYTILKYWRRESYEIKRGGKRERLDGKPKGLNEERERRIAEVIEESKGDCKVAHARIGGSMGTIYRIARKYKIKTSSVRNKEDLEGRLRGKEKEELTEQPSYSRLRPLNYRNLYK